MLSSLTSRPHKDSDTPRAAILRIMERYPMGPKFDDMEPLEDGQGEPFIVEKKGGLNEENMMDTELGPSNQKRLREASYEANNE